MREPHGKKSTIKGETGIAQSPKKQGFVNNLKWTVTGYAN